ncbi:hypothetical protein I7I48_03167 [Histoplasma ohiense]|nr:hypothetical protein I7I48_03167 [Histoplasma ohiense (nom. inval.)]
MLTSLQSAANKTRTLWVLAIPWIQCPPSLLRLKAT